MTCQDKRRTQVGGAGWLRLVLRETVGVQPCMETKLIHHQDHCHALQLLLLLLLLLTPV
jgi:hypothetical protein